MALISSLFRRLLKSHALRTVARGPGRARLQLALLEDRTVPTMLTWTGAVSGDWSNPNNWDDDALGGEIPDSSDDILIFPTGANNQNTNNDIVTPLTVSEIQINDAGYSLGGNAVGLDTSLTSTNTFGTNFISLSLTGAGFLSKSGAGFLILSGTNSYTGATTVSAGTLSVLGDANLGTGTLDLSGGAILSVTGATTIDNDIMFSGAATISNAPTVTLSGVLSGTGDLTKTGAGTLALSNTGNEAAFSGGITVTAGGLAITDDDNLGAGTLTLSGGGFSIGANTTVDNAITLNAASTTVAVLPGVTATLSGVISETGGARALTKFDGGALVLSGANTFTGAVTVLVGDLGLAGGAALADAVAVTVGSGATLTLLSIDETIGSLTGSGNVDLGMFTLTAGGDNASTTYSGVLSGTGGGLTKAGTGILTLSGTNTYTGATTVTGGVLSVAADANLGAGTVDLGTGTTLSVTGATTINNAVTLSGAATVSNTDAVTLSGVLSGTGDLTKAGAGTLTLSNTGNAGGFSGGITVTTGGLTIADDDNLGTGAVDLDTGTTLSVTGATTINNAIALSGAATVSNAMTVTLSGVLSGTGDLTKTGAGTLALSNTGNEAVFSGGITVTTGGLTIADDDNLGTGAVALGAGTTLSVTGATTIDNAIALSGAATVSNAMTVTLSGVLSGTGDLTKTGAGTLVLSNTGNEAVFSGGITVAAGGLTITDDDNLGSGALTLSGGAFSISANTTVDNAITLNAASTTVAVLPGVTATLSGVISETGGARALTKFDGGTLVLSGANTFTGAATVLSGDLGLAGGAALADAVAVNVGIGATLTLSTDETIGSLTGAGGVALGTFTLTAGGDNTTTAFAGVASGTGGLTKVGTGTLTLSGANTYTGDTAVSAGNLTLAGGMALEDTTAVTVATGATLALSADETIGSLEGAGAVDLSTFALTTGGNNSSTTLSGAVSGTGTLFKNGTGTFTLSGTNTYGDTTVLNGTLSITADANLGTGQVILGPGSTLQVTGATTINNTLVTPGAATINNSAAVEISAAISGPGGITKTGTGTLTLSATNTYTGATTVAAGTLLVEGSIPVGAAAVQVANGATLGGTGDVPAVTAASGGTVAPGGTPGQLRTGSLTLAAGSIFGAEITENGPAVPSDPNDQALVTGTVDLTGATLAVTLGFAPVAGTSYVLIDNDLTDAVVGTFAGLAEGAIFTANGVDFTISYVGGDGNDVVVTTLPPTVSIDNVTAVEGNTGGTSFTFTVTLTVPSSQTVTVDYTTVGGTATAGTDFIAASGTLTFAPGETSKTVTVTVNGDTAVEADETFTVVLSSPTNATIAVGTGTGTITNDDTIGTVISIGAGGGAPGTVRPVDPVTGEQGPEILAFAGFAGEIRVASGDIDGDGRADTVTGAGAGAMGGHVKVFSADGTLLRSFLAFEGFAGGVFVATGDVNGDGFDDIIVSADAGAAPHVKVFSGKDGSLLQSFFAYDVGFLGGVRVATGDVNGDGFDDIVTGSGAGAAANVKVFSGKDGSLLQSLAPYGGFAGGVFVAAGDVNGDGRDDIVTGSGPGTTAHVKVFSGADGSPLQSFFAYDAGFVGGVRVGVGSVNGRTAVLTGAGPGAGPHVKAFVDGVLVASLLAGDPSFSGGVYVG